MSEMPAERRPTGQKTWLWMIVSVVFVGGFLAWLAASSAPSTVAVVEEDGATATPTATAGVAAVTLTDLQANVSGYIGQMVRLEAIAVTSPMGTHAFWTTLPNGQPFLVKLDPALVAGGFAVAGGDVVTVAGRVVGMTDSVIAAWESQGAIVNEGQKAQAEFATQFVEVAEATAVAAPGGGQESEPQS